MTTMNESSKSLRQKSGEFRESTPPELDQLYDALGLARMLCRIPSDKYANRRALEIAAICTGEAFADVRQWCAEFRLAKDAGDRRGLAYQIAEQLDLATAESAVESAPVTAVGA